MTASQLDSKPGDGSSGRPDHRLARWLTVTAVIWVLLITASFGWNWIQTEKSFLTLAEFELRTIPGTNPAYQHRVAEQGGVYVRPTKKVLPNPHLKNLPERDLTTASGIPLDNSMPELASHRFRMALAHGAIAILGLVGLLAGGYRLRLSSERLRRSEKQFRALFAQSPMSIRIYDAQTGDIFDANPSACTAYGVSSLDMLKTVDLWMDPPYSFEDAMSWIRKAASEGPQRFQWLSRKASGELFWEELYMSPAIIDGRQQIIAVGLDITNSKRAGITILRQALAIEAADDGIAIVSSEETYIYLNMAQALIHGYERPQELVGKSWRLLYGQEELTRFDQEIMPAFLRKGRYRGCVRGKKKDGTRFDQEISLTALQRGGWICIVRDITDRNRAEAEREKLQAQLLHAQKMEPVGRLAGGVAHDYNNMLSVIIGYAQMAMEKAGPENPLQEDLGEILTAARRSAEITRQLLAFARRQPVAPKVLDLNETVEGMLKMLRRLIGEDIELRWIPGTKLWPIKIDPSQLDQILANLCVNARDAIAGVGKITIKTDNVIFDPEACNGNADIVPGEYILMSVADNGCGMDEDTRGHLFEPFFTTKEPGRGTGLGLATVYGIVRQNEGFITVYSELERGSTFNIHLPRFAGEVEKKEAEVTADIPLGNGEMLLMVEDEAAILKLGRAMLESLGYRVLTASGAAEAIALAGTHAGRIQLLVTDVVMPEMDGWNLAARLQAMDPNLRVLFISGYMGDRTEAQQVLENGGDFIRKPFSMPLLATKISEVLAKKTIFKIGIVSDAGKAWPR